jgi:hypothetical protein
MADQQLRHEREISDLEREVELLRQVSDVQREAQAVRLLVEDVGRAKEQMRTEVGELKQRIEVLEQENRRLSAANEMMKRDIGEVSKCCPKVKEDLTDLEREVAKLKEEMKPTMPKAQPLAGPAETGAVPPTHPSPPIAKAALAAPAAPPPTPATRKPSSESSTTSSSSAAGTPPATPLKVSPPATPLKPAKQFPPSVKKGEYLDVPNGIIAHLTRECGGNVHDRNVVDVISGSFEKETIGANPISGAYNNLPEGAARNAADLETDSRFVSAYRDEKEDITRTRNNWICYDFKQRRIVPTHYTIRTHGNDPGGWHLKSWLVETSTDGENWREVAHEEDNSQLNGRWFTATFAVAGGGECRFIRLVNIGRNHSGNDCLMITAWDIFGNLMD